jgi:hypothetical protein
MGPGYLGDLPVVTRFTDVHPNVHVQARPNVRSVASGGAVADGLCAVGEGYSGRLGSATCVLAAALGCCTRWPIAAQPLGFMMRVEMPTLGWAIDLILIRSSLPRPVAALWQLRGCPDAS